MEIIPDTLSFLQTALVPVLAISTFFWKADDIVLSSAGAEIIYKSIKNTAKRPHQSEISNVIGRFINDYFSPKNGLGNFLLRVLAFTLISLLILLSIYTSKTVGLSNQLLSEGFLSQFFGNGFIVVILVNIFTFSLYPMVIQKISSFDLKTSMLMLVFDVAVKVLLFIGFTAITYLFFADFYGSFSGSKTLALKAIPETLRLALTFENLTSVYLYSMVISSFPMFVVILINIMTVSPTVSKFVRSVLFWLPFESKPIRAISIVFAILTGLFSLVLSAFIVGFL